MDASTCLLRSEPTTFLEDYVMTDYTMYEMLGDSVLPRRTIFPSKESASCDKNASEKTSEDESPYLPHRPLLRRPKVRLIAHRKTHTKIHKEVFVSNKFSPKKNSITLRIKNCRSIDVSKKKPDRTQSFSVHTNRIKGVVIASGYLNRFRYKLSKPTDFPIFGALVL